MSSYGARMLGAGETEGRRETHAHERVEKFNAARESVAAYTADARSIILGPRAFQFSFRRYARKPSPILTALPHSEKESQASFCSLLTLPVMNWLLTLGFASGAALYAGVRAPCPA